MPVPSGSRPISASPSSAIRVAARSFSTFSKAIRVRRASAQTAAAATAFSDSAITLPADRVNILLTVS